MRKFAARPQEMAGQPGVPFGLVLRQSPLVVAYHYEFYRLSFGLHPS
jgi:hypothetical protein